LEKEGLDIWRGKRLEIRRRRGRRSGGEVLKF
jgi:hypothetical protein